MSFLKRLIGMKEKFDVAAAWQGAQQVADRALALFVLGARHKDEIRWDLYGRVEYVIKNKDRYAQLVQDVKRWRRSLRSSEYIRYGEWAGEMHVTPMADMELRLEYAVDNNPSKPYIITVAMTPTELYQNTADFKLRQVKGYAPGQRDTTSYLYFKGTVGAWEWDATRWDERPYGFEDIEQFPYK